jgi:hypothetical protein
MGALLAGTLALVMHAAARAQEDDDAGMARPKTQAPALYLPAPAPPMSSLAAPSGQRQHYVAQHFDAQGKFVPPHYEAVKPSKFRGYYAADEQKRAKQRQHGYKEPTPDYTTQYEDTRAKPIEGR